MSQTNTAFVALRRKRGEKGEVVETVEDVIVRRLTADRIDELKKLIKDTQEKHRYTSIASNNKKQSHRKPHRHDWLTCCRFHRKLKREAELIQAGHLDSKLQELWEEILQ